MGCKQIKDGFICDLSEHRFYMCFEHTTYLFEFSSRFGPSWFSVPDDNNLFVEYNGHMAFLWDMFEEWYAENNIMNIGYNNKRGIKYDKNNQL